MQSYRLVEHGQPLRPEEQETPQAKGSSVLLRVTASGMCHSDLHLCDGGYDLGRGKWLLVKDRGVKLPVTLGHETVGQLVALGPDADAAVGRSYLIYPWIGCGSCAVCTGGNENLCSNPRSLGIYQDGGYADYILVPHSRYLIDATGLDPALCGPYACSGLTAYSALKKLGALIHSEAIVIIGAGGLGLQSLSLLKALNGRGAVVVDVAQTKREAALNSGALAAIDGNASDALTQIADALGAEPRAVIDFVGNEQTATIGFSCLAKGGKLIMVGLFGGASPWALPLIPMKALTIQGSYVGNLGELNELIALVRQQPVQPIPTTRARLSDANQMLENLRAGRVLGRAVLVP